MDVSEFRKRGKEMVDYIADYMENVQSRRVLPEVSPGYLREMLPPRAPKKGEEWEDIMRDVNRTIMPGITHWQHPRFHAYFAAGNSWPSILADMLSDSLGVIGFSWAASPACTELETVVLDWLAKMIGLPPVFLHENGIGGGVIQGSASECVLVSLLAARHQAIKDLRNKHPFVEEGVLLSKLVGYCSKLAHSCVEKAGMIGLVKMRELEIDDNFSLRGPTLQQAMDEDRRNGLIPFFCCATLGTTAVCSFDNLHELGLVCEREGIYFHVDAAYAGSGLICPEFQYIMKGIEHANSFNFNPSKWMLVNFDCSTMWVRDRKVLVEALTVDPLYLQHHNSDKAIDFRHWGIPLSRRFRSLKLWFVIRSYGVEGLQKYIREHCRLAKKFEHLVKKDSRFEVLGKVTMGLVCFRFKGQNYKTQMLLRAINMTGKIHMVPALINDDYVIRFAICAQNANDDDINYAWNLISTVATDVLHACDSNREDNEAVKEIERIESLDIAEEDEPEDKDESIVREHTKQEISALPLIQDEDKDEDEEEEDDDYFLFDNNIPSIPSCSSFSNNADLIEKRNRMLKRISDPKQYTNPLLLRSISKVAAERRSRDRTMMRSVSLQPRRTMNFTVEKETFERMPGDELLMTEDRGDFVRRRKMFRRVHAEKSTLEENEEDDVFLYDNNIPSIPSISTHTGSPIQNGHGHLPPPITKRNKLLRMISDPKCYNPRILKSLSHQKRHGQQQQHVTDEYDNNSSRDEYPSSGDVSRDNSRNGSTDGYFTGGSHGGSTAV